MDDNKIPLKVIGLTNSTIQSSSWAVILAETNGPYKIPVVIGTPEAQAISIELNGYTPPRPLTHDLLVSLCHGFGVELTEVFIYRFEDGIFYSQLTFADSERTIEIDSRTSDAIAIALRFHAPIYTTRTVIEATGMIIDVTSEEDNESTTARQEASSGEKRRPKIENYTVEELEKLLEKLIAAENYEEAARVSEILNRKRGK